MRAWRPGLDVSVYYLGVSRSQRSGRLLSRGLSGHSTLAAGSTPTASNDRGPLMPVSGIKRSANQTGPGTVSTTTGHTGQACQRSSRPGKPARIPQPARPKTYTRSYKPTRPFPERHERINPGIVVRLPLCGIGPNAVGVRRDGVDASYPRIPIVYNLLTLAGEHSTRRPSPTAK